MEYFEFLTLLSDVQNAINFGPLTYRCSELRLILFPPPPPHFNTIFFLRDPEKIHELIPPSREALLEHLELRDFYLKKFHDLWYKEYLYGNLYGKLKINPKV